MEILLKGLNSRDARNSAKKEAYCTQNRGSVSREVLGPPRSTSDEAVAVRLTELGARSWQVAHVAPVIGSTWRELRAARRGKPGQRGKTAEQTAQETDAAQQDAAETAES